MYIDCVLEKMKKEKIALTKSNYRLLAFWDANYVPGAEELAEFPEEYDTWPESDEVIH